MKVFKIISLLLLIVSIVLLPILASDLFNISGLNGYIYIIPNKLAVGILPAIQIITLIIYISVLSMAKIKGE